MWFAAQTFQALICLQDLLCCEATRGDYLPLGSSFPPLEGGKKLVVRLPRWFVCLVSQEVLKMKNLVTFFFLTQLFNLRVDTPFLICFSEQIISRAPVSRKYRKKCGELLLKSWSYQALNAPLVFALLPKHALYKTLSNKNNLDVKVTDKYLSMITTVTLETQQRFYSHLPSFYVWRFPCVTMGNHWEAPWRARWVSLKERKFAFTIIFFFFFPFFPGVRKLLKEYEKQGNF